MAITHWHPIRNQKIQETIIPAQTPDKKNIQGTTLTNAARKNGLIERHVPHFSTFQDWSLYGWMKGIKWKEMWEYFCFGSGCQIPSNHSLQYGCQWWIRIRFRRLGSIVFVHDRMRKHGLIMFDPWIESSIVLWKLDQLTATCWRSSQNMHEQLGCIHFANAAGLLRINMRPWRTNNLSS